MNKPNFKTALQLTACAFAAIFALQNPVQAFADSKPLYVSDMITVTADTPEEAKNILTNAGYRVLDKDVHEAAGGSKCVYIGYKTTEDPEEAITDIKTMNTSGNFSYPAYEDMLKDQRESLERFSKDLIAALKDYRLNYANGITKAVIAHDCMNYYRDDDSGQLMGDLLLNEIREEMGADKYDKLPEEEKKKHADMTTIVMQGNSYNFSTLMGYLALAQDTENDTWTERLGSAPSADEMRTALQEEHATLSRGKVDALLSKEYDEDAKILANAVQTVRDDIAAFKKCDLPEDATEEEIMAYFEAHPEVSPEQYQAGCVTNMMLSTTAFQGRPLAELLLDEELDFTANEEDRAELYPLLSVMTDGQRRLLGYVSLQQMLTNGTMDEASWKDMQTKVSTELKEQNVEIQSMFAGVRRDVFDPTGIALTDSAQRLEGASGRSWMTEVNGLGFSQNELIGAAVGATVLSIAMGLLTKKISEKLEHTLAVQMFALRDAERKNLYDLVKFGFKTSDGFFHIHETPINAAAFTDEKIADSLGKFQKWYNDKALGSLDLDSQKQQIARIEEKMKGLADDAVENLEFTAEDVTNLKKYVEAEEKAVNDMMKQNNIKASAPGLSFLRFVGLTLCIVFALAAVVSLVMLAISFFHKEKSDVSTSPRILVSAETAADGSKEYTYYDAVKNGASLKGEPTEDDLKALPNGDLGAGEGVEWLVLYTTKDSSAGNPILADSLKVSQKANTLGAKAVSMFGSTSSQDVTEKWYGPNDHGKDGKTYISFKQDTPATAAALSNGTLVAGGVACTAIGALLGMLLSKAGKSSRQRRLAMTAPEAATC